MGILDELVEKKNLLNYIGLRIENLQYEYDELLRNLPEKKRNKALRKIRCWIFELGHMKRIILEGNNRIKKRAIIYYKINWKKRMNKKLKEAK